MSDIETAAESQACQAAMERLAECGWSLDDEDDNHALIRMWVHGRDWQRSQAALNHEARTVETLRAALLAVEHTLLQSPLVKPYRREAEALVIVREALVAAPGASDGAGEVEE